jgi:hypothetical protein
MADGVDITAGSGTTIATDDIGGDHFQRVKVTWGADGTANDTSASDPLPVAQATESSATCSNVSASASSVTLLSSASTARGRTIFNDSTSVLYVKLGSTASTTSFTVKMDAYDYYELPPPLYTGAVDGIWDTATGAARMTEW